MLSDTPTLTIVNTVQSWTAFASSLPLSLTSGGPASIIWGEEPSYPPMTCHANRSLTGLLVAGICSLCVSVSLAEFLSAYPTYVYLIKTLAMETVEQC